MKLLNFNLPQRRPGSDMTFDEGVIRGELTLKIKENWENESTAPPDFLPLFTADQRRENEKRISGSLDRFRKQMNAFSPLPGRKKRWKREMEPLLHDMALTEPLLAGGTMSREAFYAFENGLKEMVRRIRRFDPSLNMEAMGQALRNYIVYAVFLELNGLPQKCTPEIFGYSMLYPYTDNFMDAEERSGEELLHYTKLIADKIEGKSCDAVTPHDRRTVELLALIEGAYQRPDDIYTGLLLMLKAQKESRKQCDRMNPLTEEQVLTVSILKGGLSVLIDRYFIGTVPTQRDCEFYFGFGFLLQLCDDLQDISIDRKAGSRTVFSISGSAEESVLKVNRLFHFMKKLFALCECEREEFREFIMQKCSLLILFSAAGSKEHMTGDWLVWLEERLPVSADFLEELRGGFSPEVLEKDNKELMKIIDALVE